MKSRFVGVLAAMLFISLSAFAQAQAGEQGISASLDGTTGLFKTWDADSLQQGEAAFTFGYDLHHRDPGKLSIGRALAGVAYGVYDRFEIFGVMEVQKHIEADGIALYRRDMPDQLVMPAQTVQGDTYFGQSAPFIEVPESTGRGDISIGVKYSFLSERRDDSFSVGGVIFGTIPGYTNNVGLARGLSAGAHQVGFAVLLSKTVNEFARLHLNYGTKITFNPVMKTVAIVDDELVVENTALADLSNEFFYRGGVEFPASEAVRVISEINGIKYYGTRTIGANPKSPIDMIFGMRVYPRKCLSLGAGYQVSFRHTEEVEDVTPAKVYPAGYNGFVAQGTFTIEGLGSKP